MLSIAQMHMCYYCYCLCCYPHCSQVKRSSDRLGATLTQVYTLLSDVEGTTRMFGRKKAFGKRIQVDPAQCHTQHMLHSTVVLNVAKQCIAACYSYACSV
jgi:hypothetical protein